MIMTKASIDPSEVRLFSGSSNRQLANDIARRLGVPLEEPLPASEEESPVGDEAAPPDGSGVIAPSGFNAYMDDGLHFSLAYPDGWELDEVPLEAGDFADWCHLVSTEKIDAWTAALARRIRESG